MEGNRRPLGLPEGGNEDEDEYEDVNSFHSPIASPLDLKELRLKFQIFMLKCRQKTFTFLIGSLI